MGVAAEVEDIAKLFKFFTPQAKSKVLTDLQKAIKAGDTFAMFAGLDEKDVKAAQRAAKKYADTARKDASSKQRYIGTGKDRHVARGVEGWDSDEIPLGQTTKEFVINDVVLPVAGDIAGLVGRGYGTYQSILGSALAAMGKGVLSDNSVYGSLDGPMAAATAKNFIKGAIVQDAGNTIEHRIKQIAENKKSENQLKRMRAYNMNEVAPATLYEATSKTLPNGPKSAI